MKAVLLAAGTGSRLRPVTDATPKCMLELGGQPLLDIWLDSFARSGVDEVLVNLHHLHDVVSDHLDRRAGPPEVRTVYEPKLLGSAGTLVANRDWLATEDFFLACNADNLTEFDLSALIDFHLASGMIASLTVFRSPTPSACGIVEVDRDGTVVGYAEKPASPPSDLANAGIYAFAPSVLDEIGPPPADIGYDLLPKLVGRSRALLIEGFFLDIGTMETYRRAEAEWPVRRARWEAAK